jgi:hypothetical protein
MYWISGGFDVDLIVMNGQASVIIGKNSAIMLAKVEDNVRRQDLHFRLLYGCDRQRHTKEFLVFRALPSCRCEIKSEQEQAPQRGPWHIGREGLCETDVENY